MHEHSMMKLGVNMRCQTFKSLFSIAVTIATAGPAFANGIGENAAWQFPTTADMVNRAYLEDMRLKRSTGYYSTPNITNIIDKQYNCSVSANSTGNSGVSTIATSGPSTAGNSSGAVGNESQSSVGSALPSVNDPRPGASALGAAVNGTQSNTGAVQSTASGDVSSVVGDTNNYQALNSTQTNSGSQAASVASSTACTFAAAR